MTPDEILNDRGNQKHEVDIGVALIRIIELGCFNTTYLQSILKRQVETQELIKGNTEINENVSNRLEELEKMISKVAAEKYHEIMHKVLK
jgi:hypothetical protein